VREVLRTVAFLKDARGTVVADQLGGREVGVPFDEMQGRAAQVGDGTQDGGLAGARRTFEEQIATRAQGREEKLSVLHTSHDPRPDALLEAE
jgi:hypothetical protein